MSDDPDKQRIARLIEELDELPLEERDAAIAALPYEDRVAVLEAEAQAEEEVLPEDEELGGEG